jgi:short-subunit dehydrogenase
VAALALQAFGRIDVWVNNAAVSAYGRFEGIPVDTFRQVIETNLFGYVNGARAVLPVFREQGGGVLINVSSIDATIGQPFASPYTISKWAIRGLSTALREELWGENIDVCTVLPASIDTPIFQHAANYTGQGVQAMKPVVNAGRVAKAIVRLAERPKRETFVGFAGRLSAIEKVFLPRLVERLAARKVRKEQFAAAQAAITDGAVFSPMEGWTA